MAYQNVGTPRFYIDELSWLRSIGLVTNFGLYQGHANYEDKESISRLVGLTPSSQSTFTHDGNVNNTQLLFTFKDDSLKMDWANINFWGVLGHDFANRDDIKHRLVFRTINDTYPGIYTTNEIVNANITGHYNMPQYNGFSLVETSGLEHSEGLSMKYLSFHVLSSETGSPDVTGSFSLGSVVYGRYWDCPHSPDLKLTMTREMDGVKRIRTKGGSDLVNHKYIKPAMWGDAGAWELYSGTPTGQALSRSGRRVWDLSFSYLQDSDIFPNTSSLSNFGNADWSDSTDDSIDTENTILNSDTFYSEVIHKTNGGQLPFIFQPDSSNNNPEAFAICKMDMNSFKFDQVAKNIYNIKLKIREVW